MIVVFMGAGALACPALDALFREPAVRVAGVVTRPDRPRGRGLEPGPCPLRRAADAARVPVLAPDRADAPEPLRAVRDWSPDAIVVAAYGQFLSREWLELPPLGCINIHPSLLPRYRGAAPIQWAVANGDPVTGVTILHMTERMDAGDMILQEREEIRPDDTAGSLEVRLAQRGARMLVRALEALRSGRAPRVPQDESAVVRAPLLKKRDGRIDWTRPAAQIRNRIRGFQPWPGSFFEWPPGSGRTVKVFLAEEAPGRGAPGEVLRGAGSSDPVVAAGNGALRLRQVQPPGGRKMSGADFARGARWAPGHRLG